jgi:hypothetical protein
MSKKIRNGLQALGADRVTEKLGEYCQKALQIHTDKTLGAVRTAFRFVGLVLTEHAFDLLRVAAETNGVAYGGHDDTLAAIVEATEKRGSNAAAKIKIYVSAIERYRKAEEGEPGYFRIRRRIMIAKKLGPNPV